MTSVGLMFAGVALLVNGLALLGRVDARSVVAVDLLVGGLQLGIALTVGFQGESFAASQTLLFSFTYLWLAYNSLMKVTDARAFGWYCLFVTTVAVPTSFVTFDDGGPWFGVFWLVWATLWFLFFLLLALGKERIMAATGAFTVFVGVATCMVPGFLITSGRWDGI